MRQYPGFSLVEMLVVLFIIVLMIGLVSVNVNSGIGDRELEDRLEALATAATYALDEAQFSGSDYGLLFVRDLDDDGRAVVVAHWRQRETQGWRVPATAPEIFVPIVLPEAAEPDLRLDNVEVEPADSEALDPLAGVAPQWLFAASGETQTGELRLRRGGEQPGDLVLAWDALARFERRDQREFDGGSGRYDEG
ncbi:MAG: GspH/FimT family pseudopilin [Pseudomonadota bacterium]